MDAVIDAVKNVFYGLWANMISWQVYQRAMVVLLAAEILFAVLLLFVMKALGKLCKAQGKQIVKIIYLFWQRFLLPKDILKTNQITGKFESFSGKVGSFGEKLMKFRFGKIRYYVIFYLLCIFLIGLPDMLKGSINENYSHIFSFGQTIYCNWESGINERAKAYEPIIVKQEEETEILEMEEESTEDVVWLRLSQAGIDGANVRSGPGKEHDVTGVLRGEQRLRYVTESGSWCYVESEDGTQGWVNRKLLERIE